MAQESPVSERLPRVVGPARLLRRLGSGGAGTVYAATLESPVGSAAAGAEVAVKVLDPSRLDPRHGIERARREAAMGASIDHPGVVRPHGLVEAEDQGTACHLLVMELVHGTTLREVMTEMGTLPEPLARHVLVQLSGALAAAHALGIVHRDVKPENVLIGADHQVKLTDLGIARTWAQGSDLTTTGAFVGSFAYASPEHLGVGDLRPASDMYSLGVLLYEAASGRRPFEDATLGGLVRQHLERRPKPLGEAAPQVSPFLEDLVTCLLEKDPARRIASGVDLLPIARDAESSAWWRDRDGRSSATLEQGRRRPRSEHQSRFVGRESDLRRARDLVGRGLRGEGAALLVEGEAGVGKSRFVEELLDGALEGPVEPVILRGDAEGGGVGRGPIAAGLVAHHGESRLIEALERHLSSTPTVVPALASWLLGVPAADGQAIGRDALHAALVRLALSMASERPLAWVVEDLHAASPEDRALALALARATSGAPAVVIVTARPQLSLEDLAAWERIGATRLPLPRLSPRAVIELLVGVLGSQRLAEEIGGRVAAKTDGNPYFVLEIARELQQRGAVVRRPDGTWSAKQRIASIDVPSSVRALLLERLAGVSHDERAILDAAAVQGFRFDGDLIARVLGSSRLAVLQSLAVLERRFGLVRASGAAYQFDHHQLQEVLLESIPQPLRVEYNALAAQALVARGALESTSAEGEPAVRLVRHALEGDLADVASRHLGPALDHLRSQLEFEATIELGRLALTRLPPRSPAAALAGTRLALALEKVARLDEGLAAARSGLEAALAVGDPMLEGQARHALLAVQFHLNDFAGALETAEAGLEAARRGGDRFTEGKILGALGILHRFGGRVDLAEARLRESVRTLEEVGAKGNLAVSLGNLATALRVANRPGADELYQRSIRLAEEAGELGHAALMEGNLGSMLLERCDWESGTRHVMRSLESSRLAGMRRTEAGNLQRLVDRAIHLGDLDEAERLLPETIDVANGASDLRVLAQSHSAAGEIARARGDFEAAAVRYEEGIETFRRARAGVELVPHVLRRAGLAWELGDCELAGSLVAEAVACSPAPDAHLAAWRTLVHGSEPPAREDVDALPLLVRLEAHGLLARARVAGHREARAALAESLASTLDPEARVRFMTWGAGRCVTPA